VKVGSQGEGNENGNQELAVVQSDFNASDPAELDL
jgi:hypothetical protein